MTWEADDVPRYVNEALAAGVDTIVAAGEAAAARSQQHASVRVHWRCAGPTVFAKMRRRRWLRQPGGVGTGRPGCALRHSHGSHPPGHRQRLCHQPGHPGGAHTPLGLHQARTCSSSTSMLGSACSDMCFSSSCHECWRKPPSFRHRMLLRPCSWQPATQPAPSTSASSTTRCTAKHIGPCS